MGWGQRSAPSDASIIAAQDDTIEALEDRLDTIRTAATEAATADGIAWFAAVDRLITLCQEPR